MPPYPLYPFASSASLGVPKPAKAGPMYGYRELIHGLSANPVADLNSGVVAKEFADPGSFTPPAISFGPTGNTSQPAGSGNSIASAFGPGSGTLLGAAIGLGSPVAVKSPPVVPKISTPGIASDFAAMTSISPNAGGFSVKATKAMSNSMAFGQSQSAPKPASDAMGFGSMASGLMSSLASLAPKSPTTKKPSSVSRVMTDAAGPSGDTLGVFGGTASQANLTKQMRRLLGGTGK